MKTSIASARYRWGFTFVVTNLAVLTIFVVVLATGQFHNERDFLHSLAYSLVFANLTSILGMLALGVLIAKLGSRLPPLALSIAGIFVIVPVGCLAAQALLVLVRWVPADHFWSQYLQILRIAMPLALVFGLGALAYATLRARLEVAELRLHEKELAEERARKLVAEARLHSLESWIHPHFLFNTLNSISALIAVDPPRADQIVARLAALLRASLDSGTHSLIPLREELALIESYLDIERVRLGARLQTVIDVPSALAETPVPPMSLQSLVENAVKYGVTPLPTGGIIRVIAAAQNGIPARNSVCIDVCDSGPGFDLGAIPARHGLDMLVQRLDSIYGERASLKVFRRDGFSVVEMEVPRP